MKFAILDVVFLNRDLAQHDLRVGDLGAVVELYETDGVEVEFVRPSGETKALVTLRTTDLRRRRGRHPRRSAGVEVAMAGAQRRKTYRVAYKRDAGRWWVASVRGVRGCHTQGRSFRQTRERIREALGLFVTGADRVRVVDDLG